MIDLASPHAPRHASPPWIAVVLLARATGTAFVARRRPGHRRAPGHARSCQVNHLGHGPEVRLHAEQLEGAKAAEKPMVRSVEVRAAGRQQAAPRALVVGDARLLLG